MRLAFLVAIKKESPNEGTETRIYGRCDMRLYIKKESPNEGTETHVLHKHCRPPMNKKRIPE